MASLGLEQRALDQLFDERAHAELAAFGAGEDGLDVGAVAEANGGAGGEHRELAHEVSRQGRLILQEELLELAHILERSSVGQGTGRIDRQGPVELELLAVEAV